jgi:hypothetical protein
MTEGSAGSVVALDRPQAPGWRRGVALFLGLVLVVGWVAWALLTWQSQLRFVTVEDLKSDVAGGHVTSYLIVSNVRPTRTWPATGSIDLYDLPALDEQGNAERTPGSALPVLMYFTDHTVGPTRVLDPGRFSAYAEMYAQELRASGVPTYRGTDTDVPLPDDRYQLWGLGLGVLALGSVVFGPRPDRGTRFFWFWVIGIVDGLGVLAYAVGEPLRQARGSGVVVYGGQPAEQTADGWRRLRGWHGLVLAFALSTALTVLVGARGTHLDGIVFPHW